MEEPLPTDEAGIWTSLQEMLDIKQFKPKQAEGIVSKEMMDGSGHHFMLKNGRTHIYARLSPEEFWVWQQFNGEKTIQQIVLDYFMEYKSFAFGAVAGLFGRLVELHMLSERPHYLYQEISQELHKRTFTYKATWLARLAFTKEWSIKGLDSHLERIYKYGGWILFSVPLQIAFLLVSILGTYLFFQISKDPQYALFSSEGSTTIVKLGLLAYIPLLIHEFGHAITAKHFKCEVYKGGAMLYYGLPAAFVDTTDVWMHGKRARLAVTWAGPYTGYIISGLSALIVYFWKDIPLVTAISILQIGMIGFFTSTMNVLPLLKLDGYYILADALEIPRLRERSMDFIVKSLRFKLIRREKWTRDEYIFLVFGMLAFLSTFYFTYAGIRYWDAKTTSSISTLFVVDNDIVEQLKNIGTVLLAVSSIAYSLYLLVMRGTALVAWLRRIGLLSHRIRSALVIVASVVVILVLPPVLLPTLSRWFMIGLGLFSFALASWMSFINYRKMRGSIHVGMWVASMLGLALGAVSFMGNVKADWVVAGFGAYEAGLVLSVVTFVLAGRLLKGLQGSWRAVSISLFALGAVVWGMSLFLVDISIKVGAGMLLGGALFHWNMRPPSMDDKKKEKRKSESTRERMVHAFHHIRLTILGELEKDFGAQTRKWVDNGDYRRARRLFGGEKLDDSGYDATMTGMTPNDYGGAMALNLDELLLGVEKAAGRQYAVRMLAHGYDSLDWEEQEITEDYLLKYVKQAKGLSQQLKDARNDIGLLLRSVPLFTGMSDKDIAVLNRHLVPKRFNRGETIVRQGEVGETFYLIHAGSVEVVRRFDPKKDQSPAGNALVEGNKDQVMIIARNRKLATLGRGNYFGELALLTGEKRNATVRAITPVEVLCLSRKEFNKLLRENFDEHGEVRNTIRHLSMLNQIPLFSEFESSELRLLETKLEQVNLLEGQEAIKHGDKDNHFYMIGSGKVSVRIPYTDEHGETQIAERASLGSGEFFGEISLLLNTSHSATIVALKPTVLLRLDAVTFNDILNRSNKMKQAVERTASRRVLANKRWLNSLAEVQGLSS